MTAKEKKDLADKMVSNFISRFREAVGTTPIVTFSIVNDAPTINEIYNVVNTCFKKHMGRFSKKEVSISDDNREFDYIKYRNVYFSICRDFGYTCESIGSVVGKNHATVLHGCKRVKEGSELKKEMLEKLFPVEEEAKELI